MINGAGGSGGGEGTQRILLYFLSPFVTDKISYFSAITYSFFIILFRYN